MMMEKRTVLITLVNWQNVLRVSGVNLTLMVKGPLAFHQNHVKKMERNTKMVILGPVMMNVIHVFATMETYNVL
jgi:hypothetical protein